MRNLGLFINKQMNFNVPEVDMLINIVLFKQDVFRFNVTNKNRVF